MSYGYRKRGAAHSRANFKKSIRGGRTKDYDAFYEQLDEVRDTTQTLFPDDYTTAVDHMYNEMYGKAFVHMPKAVTIEAMKTLRRVLKTKGFATSPSALKKDPELKKKIQAIAELVYPSQDQTQTRTHQLALQEKYFSNVDPENYDIPLEDFREEDDAFEKSIKERRYERVKVGFELSFPEILDDAEMQEFLDSAQKDILIARKKEYGRIRRKIAETRFLVKVFKENPQYFEGINHVVDMAGGAGDLGIATATELPEVDVVIAEYDDVLGPYSDYLKNFDPDVAERVTFETGPLQTFEVSPAEAPNTAFVAKHPCGGLKEDIVTKAIESEVPTVIMMTCCQDKMCDHADQYFDLYKDMVPEIQTKDDFLKYAKNSARTNISPEDFKDDPKQYEEKKRQRAEGEEAMRVLDAVTVKRLEKAGYDVRMVVMPGAHKGNVIMAKKHNT